LRSLVPLSMDVLSYSHPKAPRGFETLNIWIAETKIWCRPARSKGTLLKKAITNAIPVIGHHLQMAKSMVTKLNS
jgi:hypothetical protein